MYYVKRIYKIRLIEKLSVFRHFLFVPLSSKYPEKERQVERLVFSFSTKSVLSDGINPSSMDEITCVMKSDFVGLGDGFNFICEADFIQATLGFHHEHKRTISLSLAPSLQFKISNCLFLHQRYPFIIDLYLNK